MEKVWFITGTSKGFGHEFARAALERGDKVAATARTSPRWPAWPTVSGTPCCR